MIHDRLYFKKAVVLNGDCTITKFYSFNKKHRLKSLLHSDAFFQFVDCARVFFYRLKACLKMKFTDF
jgi:hypothetical protein